MNYCPDCGAALQQLLRAGRARRRWHCAACQQTHTEHPAVLCTCFVNCGPKLLWVQRRFEPRSGCWAIPGGFLEAGESSAEGAARELQEEAGIAVPAAALTLYMAGTITFINQVYVAYRASVDSEFCAVGEEALAAAFFSRTDCPWEQLAYPEVNNSIQQAYDDLERGQFGVYHAELSPDDYRLERVLTGPDASRR